MFKLTSWSENLGASHYVSWILRELGRLDMTIEDIETHNPPRGQRVLSSLLEWRDDFPNFAHNQLTDYANYDFVQIDRRAGERGYARPQIEVTAEINRMGHLTVRWYPLGWREAEWFVGYPLPERVQRPGSLEGHDFKVEPDFRHFIGDDVPPPGRRPANELLYVQGVRELRPEPVDSPPRHGWYNRDVVHSMLICAVRATYDQIVSSLRENFDVVELDEFVFETRDEIDDDAGAFSLGIPKRRVTSFSIQEASRPDLESAEVLEFSHS